MTEVRHLATAILKIPAPKCAIMALRILKKGGLDITTVQKNKFSSTGGRPIESQHFSIQKKEKNNL